MYKSELVSYLKNQISDSKIGRANNTIMYDIDGRNPEWDKDNLVDTQDNRKLKATIIGVSSWEDEITRIKSLLNISSSDEATDIFTTIEESEILNPCKAHVMIKLVTLINNPCSK